MHLWEVGDSPSADADCLTRVRIHLQSNRKIRDLSFWTGLLFLVERRGFEPLTPTLPVLCATNCANAPY